MPPILIAFLIVYASMWSTVIILNMIFKRRLKSAAPHLAEKITPGLFNKSISTDFNANRFIMKKEYRSINNPGFVKFCDFYRLFSLLWYGVFGITIVSMVIYFLTHQKTS